MVDAVLGGWELNSINTAHTSTLIDVSYAPSTANDVTGLVNDYRGEAILRPNVSGMAARALRAVWAISIEIAFCVISPWSVAGAGPPATQAADNTNQTRMQGSSAAPFAG